MIISVDNFLLGLLIISVATGLVTQAIKTILDEHKKTYHANTLTGMIAIFLSVFLCVGYVIINYIAFSWPLVVICIALAFISWLCAMVGYDKIIQAIDQIKKGKY